MPRPVPALVAAALVILAGGFTPEVRAAAPGVPVTLRGLLAEMADLDALARLPRPAYQQRQASSYNRRSVAPDKPGWFADSDGVGFLRKEQHDGKTEWVLMEHNGPGCLTRIWTPFFYYGFGDRTGPNVRIYLDGDEKPTVDCSLIALVTAKGFVGEPFARYTARAGDLYLPIPFGTSCKITMRRKPFYYSINYRAYPKGTRVEPFTMAAFEAAKARREAVGRKLVHPPAPPKDRLTTADKVLPPGGEVVIPTPAGPAAIRYLRIRLTPSEKGRTDYLRSTVLVGRFDGEDTVWCPVGDFFGCADAIHPFRTFAREVPADGAMICRWVMPYQKSAELKLRNLGKQPVTARVGIEAGRWTWDERSMHFHANWRPDDVAAGSRFQDWNFIEIRGCGVFVGDQWTVLNPNGSWWGEGDEKIYIDDDLRRKFPSHFGTGTEDYYGWAGGRVPTLKDEFSQPYLANIRVGGQDGWTRGFNICARHRGLDAIPFSTCLRFDMESSFGTSIRNPWNLLSYSAVTWWYARPGASHNRPPCPQAAARAVTSLDDLDRRAKEIRSAQTHHVEGAIEFETLTPTARSAGLGGKRQVPHPRFRPKRMSAQSHYFVPGRRKGDFVEFTFAEQYKPRHMIVHLVRSYDFGIVQLWVNGKRVGKPIDLYEPDPVTIYKADLGVVHPAGNVITLRVELVGKNPRSRGSGSYFGLDCAVLKPPDTQGGGKTETRPAAGNPK